MEGKGFSIILANSDNCVFFNKGKPGMGLAINPNAMERSVSDLFSNGDWGVILSIPGSKRDNIFIIIKRIFPNNVELV